jgi:glycolate oxidase iron-sulfur subunit
MVEQNPACPENTKLSGPLDQGLLSACIHCGLCLPACPTYLASGRETESPRGRIYLLSQWNTGQLPFDDDLTQHIDSCLGCLGCQTACPSGVQYEKIINQARPFLAEKRPAWKKFLMRTVFDKVLPNYSILRLNGFLLRIMQALGIDKMLSSLADRNEHLQKDFDDDLLSPHLVSNGKNIFLKFARWNSFLPSVPRFKKLPVRLARSGANAGTVQLFSGCMMDVFYNQVNHAAMNLLSVQNRIVENPPQTCCGALAFHAGDADIAAKLARCNIELFSTTTGPIAVTAAGCGAMLKEYGHLLKDDPAWAKKAKDFSSRVVDITEALAAGKFEKVDSSSSNIATSSANFAASFANPVTSSGESMAKSNLNVAYHAACHLAHAQSVRVAPSELLQLLSELSSEVRLIPLKDAEQCCGSAGIYNLLHPEMALKVLDRKMDNVENTGADVIVSTNPGCLLQLEAGIRRRGLKMKVKHLCELLADYYC